MTKGRLIILEAGDASGKATQTKLLFQRLTGEGHRVRRVEFPDYGSDSSALVRMYLSGAFGAQADAVGPYAASAFFAVDRFASYQMKWKDFYLSGGIVLADRYVTSNLAHQAVKIDDLEQRRAYVDWLQDFEYEKLGLPRPDRVVFLDMAPEVSDRLLAARARETGTADIHEHDRDYLHRCHAAYQDAAARFGWHRVLCSEGGEPRRPEVIAAEVYAAVAPLLPPVEKTGRE